MSEGEIGTAELGVTPPPAETTTQKLPLSERELPVDTSKAEADKIGTGAPQKEPGIPISKTPERPTEETLTKAGKILKEIKGEIEALRKDSGRLHELGTTKEDIERETGKIQEALDSLEKDPEKAKNYLFALCQQRSVLLGNVEKIVSDPERARENLKKQGASEITDQLLPEKMARTPEKLVVKAEEAEEEVRVKEGARIIREILKDLGVSEKELAEIDNLINKSGDEQLKALIEAQRELGREDYANRLKAIAGDKEKILEELKEHFGVSEETKGTKEKLTKANLWSLAKFGGIGVVLLVMLLFQLEQGQQV